jgi:hypothetical protein
MLKRLSVLFLLAGLAGVFGCQQDPQSANTSSGLQLKTGTTGGSTSAAHPVVVYTWWASGTNTALYVMDSNGAHSTALRTSNAYDGLGEGCSWAPASSSIAWDERTSTSQNIRIGDIAVGSDGVPVLSNVQTLVSIGPSVPNGTSNDTEIIRAAAWSATSTTNKIAYAMAGGTTHAGYVCTVSPSTGTIDTLYRFPAGNGNPIYVSWNSDDSKLAVLLQYSGGASSIVVIGTSTNTVTDSIALGSANPQDIDWSRSGQNKIAYVLYQNGYCTTCGSTTPYFVTPTSGSTPVTYGHACSSSSFPSPINTVTWSPNNGSLLYPTIVNTRNGNQESLVKNTAFAGTTSTLLSPWTTSDVRHMNWHR